MYILFVILTKHTRILTLDCQRPSAINSGGLRAISCQAEKLLERKDTHRKPLLPHLRVADVMAELFFFPFHFLIFVHCLRRLPISVQFEKSSSFCQATKMSIRILSLIEHFVGKEYHDQDPS